MRLEVDRIGSEKQKWEKQEKTRKMRQEGSDASAWFHAARRDEDKKKRRQKQERERDICEETKKKNRVNNENRDEYKQNSDLFV